MRSGGMNGPESERMIAEIETFLRTGEAPPAAPEPTRAVGVVRRPAETGEPEVPPEILTRRQLVWARVAGRFKLRVGIPARFRRRPSGSYRGSLDGGTRRGDDQWADRPKWTPARVVVISTLLLALLVVPSVLSRRGSSPDTNSGDRASPAPAGPGYTFLNANRSGTPVRWDPCTPIQYRTDLTGAPPYAAQDLAAGLRQVSAATGISFVNDGSTSVFPSGPATSGSAAPSSAGPTTTGQQAPVVIAWATPAETSTLPTLPAGAAPNGLGRATPVEMVDPKSGYAVYVTGTVIIEAGADKLPSGFGPGGVGNVILHELGQLMGLGPIDDPGEIMNPTVVPTMSGAFGRGDLAGLHRLGAGSGCLKPPVNGVLEPVF